MRKKAVKVVTHRAEGQSAGAEDLEEIGNSYAL